MIRLEHLPANATPETVCTALEHDGAVILDQRLDADVLRAVEADLAPFVASTAEGRNDFSGFQTRRIGALMARSPACRGLALDPLVNATSARFLAEHADGYQLHFTQAISIGPGESEQPLHRDRGVWGGYVPRRIETQLSTVWAVGAFTADNGATRVVPGSHCWPKEREPEPREVVAAEMEPGSVLLYSGTVLHGGGANRTEQRRLGVLLHYTLDWLRQEENQYLSCPPEIARELPPELRALMGYRQASALLGFYSAPTGPDEDGPELANPERLFD